MQDRKTHVEELMQGAFSLKRKAGVHAHGKAMPFTPSQWQVIAHIFRNDGCTTNNAAEALSMTGSAVTQLVNALVSKGYVSRAPSLIDGRAHKLVLTTKAKKQMLTFKKKRVAMMLKMFEALSDKEFMRYVSLNKKILASMEQKSR